MKLLPENLITCIEHRKGENLCKMVKVKFRDCNYTILQ